MPYQINWFHYENIVLCRAQGTITDAELWEMGQTLTTFLDQGRSVVHIIFDLEDMERFPKQLPSIRHMLRSAFEHPHLGSVTLMGRVNPLARCIFETLTKTFRVEYRGVVPDTQAAVREIRAAVH